MASASNWMGYSPDAHAMIRAYARLHPSMRGEVVWYISEARLRSFSKECAINLADDEPIPDGVQIFGIPVEVVESREILLVMKVTSADTPRRGGGIGIPRTEQRTLTDADLRAHDEKMREMSERMVGPDVQP